MSSDGKLGWMAGFLFVACGALRLARFNIQIGIIDSKVFNGLPIPAAASLIATTVIFFYFIGSEGKFHNTYITCSVIVLALLMVSNIKYSSFKGMNLRSRVPFIFVLIVLGILLVIYYKPEIMAFVIMLGYVISGPIWWVAKVGQKLTSKVKEKKNIQT